MSRPPFARPNPFFPPSPPETTSEFIQSARVPMPVPVPAPYSVPLDLSDQPDASFHSMNSDPYNSRPKKSSSLSYNNSTIRESRERTVQRALKSFIIVIPPPFLIAEHGQFGATLSSGPSHRLSQGVLMPLFPTMYGQLTAIAREFNFSSTAGLCLYLSYSDAGMTITPRISDEVWPFLWSGAFDSSRATGLPPISGKIEFDIDLAQARWYPSWVSARDRGIPVSPPRRPISRLHHYPTDSRTAYEDEQDDASVQQPSRHIPKKLSLVDRFDSSSSVRSLRAPSHSLSPPPIQHVNNGLSPIPQATEPPSAKVELETRVNTWRASASLKPTTLAATNGQTSLEPPNLPNTLELDAILDEDARSELNLDDFTWSISSVGPIDYLDGASIASSARVASIHIAHRAQGSVCLTESDCTSFGPSDWDEDVIVYAPSPRVATPDLAMRMWDDCPPTPSTATSWGPPLSYPSSLVSESRPPSVDLATRYLHSRPVTPSTATSWGPPLSYPPSPTSISRPPSVDLATRYFHSRPVTPSTATSWGPPSWPSSPALSEPRPPSVHLADRGLASRPVTPLEERRPWNFVWPYYSEQNLSRPWQHVWPYRSQQEGEEQGRPWAHVWPYTSSSEAQEEETRSGPWNHVWPYVGSSELEQSGPWNHVWPYVSSRIEPARPWPHVWPYHKAAVETQDIVLSATTYPIFNLYPSVYPHFNLYPSPVQVEKPVQTEAPSVSSYVYPTFNLYPAVYPHFDLYPTIHRIRPDAKEIKEDKGVVVRLKPSYPAFDLYPSGYPHKLDRIYTHQNVEVHQREVLTRVVARYPFFELYAPVYPHVQPYPSAAVQVERASVKERTFTSPFAYPHFNLYPSLHTPSLATGVEQEVSTQVLSRYPFIRLYEPMYPCIQPYASIAGQVEREERVKDIVVGIGSAYPRFELYPSVYPHNLERIYPSVSGHVEVSKSVTVDVVSSYPTFVLYKSGYPHNLDQIYPPLAGQCDGAKHIVVDIVSSYPRFVLYPCVYPYNLDYLYPSMSGECEDAKQVAVRIASSYPNFVIYSSVYPHNLERIYSKAEVMVDYPTVSVQAFHHYPVFQLYAPVYPHIVLYPQAAGLTEELGVKVVGLVKRAQRKTHAELHAFVFGGGIVDTPSGNPITPVRLPRKTHAELHASVFGSSPVRTPSGTPIIQPTRPHIELDDQVVPPPRVKSYSPITPPPRRALPNVPPLDQVLPRRTSPTSSPIRTPPSRMSLPHRPPVPPPPPAQPSPTRRLPTPPTPPISGSSNRKMSLGEMDMSDLPPARPRYLPSRPRELPRPQSTFETSSNPDVQATRRTSSLEHLSRSQSLSRRPLPRTQLLERSQSMGVPISPVREQIGDEVFEMVTGYPSSQPNAPPPPPKMGHRKADSLIFKRIRALNSARDEPSVAQTLGEFPEPPKRVPSVSRLDRSKYTAFS